MFDFLLAWIYSYNIMFVVGLVLGFLIGYGAQDLWKARHQSHETTTGAAYDGCEDEPTDDDAVARRLLNF